MTSRTKPNTIERLTVALPERMATVVRKAVSAGEYASTSEVVRDALRLWEGQRQLRTRDIALLRRIWDDGKASGRAGRLDMVRLIAEAKSTSSRRG